MCFNAARGFVGGATVMSAIKLSVVDGFNAARGFVGGATLAFCENSAGNRWFQCRTRLCGWCNETQKIAGCETPWMFQCRTRLCGWCNADLDGTDESIDMFQCRTRLCGWCNRKEEKIGTGHSGFNAARGFVGGAAIPYSH